MFDVFFCSTGPLLTTVFLMRNLNFTKFKDAIMENLEKLMAADPLRKGYYLDLSKYEVVVQLCNSLSSIRMTKNFSI